MQVDSVDAAGHKYGYGSRRYLEQINQRDALVGQVIDAIQDASVLEDGLVLVVSDRSGHERSHGPRHSDCVTISWGCRGPGIVRGGTPQARVNLMDTAAVVARVLGFAGAPSCEAHVRAGVFGSSS